MENRRVKTTDEEMKLSLKENDGEKHTYTTDEEITIEWINKDDYLTHQPKDFEDIDY
ncbi:hypothetical protein [Anoxybacteroides amylolyticum]|uniref:Uncharacterized protein n=1 Tax=Anoxybacteroides amylolyticum TaxID=294699 RepID=A0A160F2H1_9BACL|nr:hypothetical protein [Anoxybacillus amylolyticus]ANB60428.1 hypothetical protein GFC30_1192 [Anoxybacillus amylolyticus]